MSQDVCGGAREGYNSSPLLPLKIPHTLPALDINTYWPAQFSPSVLLRIQDCVDDDNGNVKNSPQPACALDTNTCAAFYTTPYPDINTF